MTIPVQDPVLQPIAEKVAAGERLTRDDALALFRTDDLLGLGAMADFSNRRRNGNRVFFSANQHINPTNVCVLRSTCTFCSFARMPKEDGAYTRTLDEVFAEAEAARGNPTREFHIVGGLHPRLRLSYYTDMIRGLKARHPGVQIKALTAVEIAHLARIEKTSSVEVLKALKESGLDTLPGGGAEVFSTAVRETIAKRKLVGEEWLQVHREAHELGIPSNCTMLYGHVETLEDRVEHLEGLRALQDETSGFLTYIPLAYHPDHNELGEELGRTGSATTGYDDLKNIAVGRLFLDNIPHVKTHWPMVTPFLSQVALEFGCDDVEGTVVYERIYHDAGATTPMMMSYGELVRFIKAAGKEPVERDSFYREVRRFADDDPVFEAREEKRETGDGGTERQVESALRLGRIAYINCYPVYGAIDRGMVRVPARLVTGSPTELNELLAVGELDVSVVSAVEYARNAQQYHLLPDLAISSDGPVRSVALFSKRPAQELNGQTVLVSASSKTSVLLLELLAREVWGVKLRVAEARAEAADLPNLAALPHEAVLVIGDPALLLASRGAYAHRYDLGEEWRRWTGLPFVFAVWAARRDADRTAVKAVHNSLLEARSWGLAHLDELARDAARRTGIPLDQCREYLSGLDYSFTYRHLEGLTSFLRRCAAHGLVPERNLGFLAVA